MQPPIKDQILVFSGGLVFIFVFNNKNKLLAEKDKPIIRRTTSRVISIKINEIQ